MTNGRPLFAPSGPTLWPAMLAAPFPRPAYYPFSARRALFYYFARNGIWHAVKAMGLEGGEVLAPAYHHGVEIEALVDAGARPRFYRVDGRWGVDLDDVARKIGRETRALYLTHYAGFPGPAAAMRRLADHHGLILIEDCALSLLSADGHTPLGSLGDVAVFCFYKALPVPNGGAIVVNGPRDHAFGAPGRAPLASTASHTLGLGLQNLELRGGAAGRALRGLVRRAGRDVVTAAGIERVATGSMHFDRDHVDLGMSPVTRMIALRQDIPRIVDRRRRNFRHLAEQIGDIATPLVGQLGDGVVPLFYPVRVRDKAPLMAALGARGVETIDFWRFFHPACDPREFPEVAALRDSVLEIPCHQDLGEEAMSRVAAAVREALLTCEPERRASTRR